MKSVCVWVRGEGKNYACKFGLINTLIYVSWRCIASKWTVQLKVAFNLPLIFWQTWMQIHCVVCIVSINKDSPFSPYNRWSYPKMVHKRIWMGIERATNGTAVLFAACFLPILFIPCFMFMLHKVQAFQGENDLVYPERVNLLSLSSRRSCYIRTHLKSLFTNYKCTVPSLSSTLAIVGTQWRWL